MSEAPNPDGEKAEAADDLAHFDELERDFHKVLQNLVNDRSTEKFREEYEQMHAALVESHEQNGKLVEKCRNLNNEILSNANKVSSVMQLSQNDQRTIAGLRHEFEKAWKLVEVSQDHENKSRDVIDNLKSEIATLSRIVEQGGAMALTEETSLQEISDAIGALKKEIIVENQQLVSTFQERKSTKQAQTG
jgi:uncharacterized coiled-coil DUF342 family protein